MKISDMCTKLHLSWGFDPNPRGYWQNKEAILTQAVAI